MKKRKRTSETESGPVSPNCDPAQRSQFGKEEGASGYGAFAAPAEAQCSWLLLTPWRFFSFSKRGEKNGGAKKRATNGRPYIHRRKCDRKGKGGHYPPDNPSVTAFAVTAPFTQGSLSAAAESKKSKGDPAGDVFYLPPGGKSGNDMV